MRFQSTPDGRLVVSVQPAPSVEAPREGAWSTPTVAEQASPGPRAAVAVLGAKLWTAGFAGDVALWDPRGGWSRAGELPRARRGAVALAVSSGESPPSGVLVLGGFDDDGNPVADVSLWDASRQVVRPLAPMSLPRAAHAAACAPREARVITCGGVVSRDGKLTAAAEVWSARDGRWTPLLSMNARRRDHRPRRRPLCQRPRSHRTILG